MKRSKAIVSEPLQTFVEQYDAETAEHHIWGQHIVEERWDLSLK
jgi:hypothetical protein